MLEILFKILFCLSMLVVYANVTSTSVVIVVVLGYIACVFSYYYFDNIQGAIDECLNYCNFNAKLADNMNPSQVSGYFVNRKYNKINNNGIGSVGGKKILGALCNSENSFSKENSLLDGCGASMLKPDFKNGELPSPILKSNSPLRSNKLCRDKLKITFNPKEVANRKNAQMYNSMNPSRRYNANLDLETYMNVNSPGFTSRVVDKAAESASYHLKYPAVRQVATYRFDKSTLRQLSKMPKVASTPAVRIAPPESTSMDLLTCENVTNEANREGVQSNSILQVLKDMSRKRNYTQEESDRTGSTPKKSRKTDVKNAMSSQYKRAHEDCSNDSIEDKSRKKRCDDSDRNIAKMMSYTSSISVLAPGDFTWNNHSKKRKSSGLEKLKNESPEKLEKFRKISENSADEIGQETVDKDEPKLKTVITHEAKPIEKESQMPENHQEITNHVDETDSRSEVIPFTEDDGEYVRVAGGKILNRTNCTYRRKLNSTKIDPDSVITNEPEYVCGSSYVDDKTMKENLLKNLIHDIERKGEKNDSVIFYQNSIVEEVAKNVVTQVEVHEPPTSVRTSSSLNPLLPPSSKPAPTLLFGTSMQVTSEPPPSSVNQSSPSTRFDTTGKPNPLLGQTNGFTLGNQSLSVTDSAQAVGSSSQTQPVSTLGASLPSPSSTTLSLAVSSTTKSDNLSTSAADVTHTSASTDAVSVPATTSIAAEAKIDKPKKHVTFASTVADKTAVTSSAPTISFGTSSNFSFGASNLSASESSNPLLSKSSPLTSSDQPAVESKNLSSGNPQMSFASQSGKPATDADAPKISMFGNTVIGNSQTSPTPTNMFSATTSAASAVSNAVATAASTPSMFSNLTQTTTTSSTFPFGQTSVPTTSSTTGTSSGLFNFPSSSSDSGFKFGTSQPTDATTSAPAFNVTSAPTFNLTPVFGGGTSTFGNNAPLTFNTTTSATFPSSSTPSFGTAATQPTPAFNFGSQPTSGFGTAASQSSVFGATTQSSPSKSTVFGGSQANSATQSSVFGTAGSQPTMFGNAGQSTATSSVFGGGVQPTQPSPVFGISSQTTDQQPSIFNTTSQQSSGPTSVFGSASQVNPATVASSATPAQPSPLFGGGDSTTNNVFGQSQNTVAAPAPPVGVVNPLPQTAQLGDTGRFTFGAGTQQPSAFGGAATPFGGAATAQPAFNSTAPTFNSSTGSWGVASSGTGNTFGANFPTGTWSVASSGTGNAFGATAAPQPASQVFAFGSSGAATSQAAPSAFQFGANASPAQPSQPFMFGSTVAPAAAAGGGGVFSIGSGGSSARNRLMARPRKAK